MKFTKEQAVEQLKGLLTEGGKTLHLSDRTINENIDDLIPLLVNDETELSDFISKALPFVKRTNANFEKKRQILLRAINPLNLKLHSSNSLKLRLLMTMPYHNYKRRYSSCKTK